MENLEHVWTLWEMILVLVVLIPLAFILNIIEYFDIKKIEADNAYWEDVRKTRHLEREAK
ncbi:MAG: hypothetical protein KAI79_17965 [Bacteroidales bacterium]|nr:hypothetical protein [Bacteroidales bacterium]